MKKRNGVRQAGRLVWALVLAAALTACSAGGSKNGESIGELEREDSGVLKIAYFEEQPFYMQYGNAFQAMYPNLQLEVLSTAPIFEAEDPAAELEQFLQERNPDVLYLTEEQYAKLAREGMLYDLEAAVKQDEFDLDAFHPSVVELLRAHGGGKLYGLSPSFTSMALYYNKDLFDKHGIPYPTDGMTWEEVLQLAERFPVQKEGDNALFGLYQSSQTTDPFSLIRMIGEAKGLLYADEETGTVSIDTPEWAAIFQTVTDGYKTGSISMPSGQHGPSGIGPGGRVMLAIGPGSMQFVTGQAAMAIDGTMMMNMLGMSGGGAMKMSIMAEKTEDGGNPPPRNPIGEFEWDVVTLPVDPSLPDVTSELHLQDVFAISATAENPSAAWAFLQYAAGEQLAKTNVKSSPALSARTAYKKEADGKNIEAFYALGVNDQLLLQELPESFEEAFAKLATEQIQKIVDGTTTVADALKTIQAQGQDLLTQALASEGQA